MSPLATGEVLPDFAFRLMVWMMKIEDIFSNPARLLNRVPIKPGMTVVDYGCGPGRYAIAVAQMVGPSGKVYAVDNQHLAIEMTRHEAERHSLANLQAVLVKGFDTGIPDGIADVVLLIDALDLIGDQPALFREIHRLTKEQGLFFVDPGHMRVASARKMIDATGLFTTVKVDGRSLLLSKKSGT